MLVDVGVYICMWGSVGRLCLLLGALGVLFLG